MAKTYTRTLIWRFDQPPGAIWAAMADTARFNEAAGIPKHRIEEVPKPGGSVRFFAKARKAPFRLEWEEIPVEWVDGQWLRHKSYIINCYYCIIYDAVDFNPTEDSTGGSRTSETSQAILGRSTLEAWGDVRCARSRSRTCPGPARTEDRHH